MIKNRTLLNDIYEPIYNKKMYSNFEQLKQIAAEQVVSASKDQNRKINKKKITK